MQLVEQIQGRVVKLFQGPPTPTAQHMDTFGVVRAIEHEFRFVEVPRTLEQFDLTNGVRFRGGTLQNMSVDELVLFEHGVMCSLMHRTTADVDRVISHLEDLLENSLKLKSERLKNGTSLYSNLMVVNSDKNLGATFRAFDLFGEFLSSKTREYGLNSSAYEAISIKFGVDAEKTNGPVAEQFVFERRANQSFGSGLYFTGAPLKTKDHLEALNLLEGLLS